MKYVLLKMNDEAAAKFVKKAGNKALGMWEVPTNFCTCDDMYETVASDWGINSDGHAECKQCGGLYKPLLSLGQRLKNALGRNLIKLYR